jgi:uncharacterized membrane protein YhaH (DUF805 family)
VACPDQNFQADFFNNVAAVAIVLIFAKVVAHRMHDQDRGGMSVLLHGIAVLAAAMAATISIIGIESCSAWPPLHWIVGVPLAAASVLLVLEILIDDVGRYRRRRRSTCASVRR